MSRARTPLLLQLEFAFEVQHADYALKPILRSIEREFWKCLHGKRSIALVILTEESSRDLVARLKLSDVTTIVDYACFVAPIGAITKHGGFSTLHVALDKAWKAVGERRHPVYRQQRQRFNPRMEQRSNDPAFGAMRARR